MIHEQVIVIANGTFFRPIKNMIIEATGAHRVHIMGFLHFEDLEISGTLCEVKAIEGRMYVAGHLGIAVVAWLTDDQVACLFIANEHWCVLSVIFLTKFAYAALVLFILKMEK